MDIDKIGQNIARLRRMNSLTQEKLAEALGITAPAVSRWENGKALPDITLLPELAQIFDCTIDHLLMVERQQEKLSVQEPTTIDATSIRSLAEQIIQIMEGKNMVGMSNQSIIDAFSEKHGYLGDVTVIRNRSTKSHSSLVNSITLKVNQREYQLLEKILFGDVTELYRTKLLCDFGIFIPVVYKIDYEEKIILLEDLSENYICGREFDENTKNGTIYREAYKEIAKAAASFHLSFWNKDEAFQQIGLPWYLESVQNAKLHIDGLRGDLKRFQELFPKKLSEDEVQCFEGALSLLEERLPEAITNRFHKGKNITIVHGDMNPSNVFVSKNSKDDIRFIDMEAVRMGLPTEDLAMFFALHVEPGKEAITYLNQYYHEIKKTIQDYSMDEFINDYSLGIMMTMFHPIGIVGVRMKILDENMIHRAVKAYHSFVEGSLNIIKEMSELNV